MFASTLVLSVVVLLMILQILLSPRGRFYLIALKQNDVPGIRRTLSVEYGLNSQVGPL